MVKARVNIETANGRYHPGDIIRENLRAEDMDFLKRKGFIDTEEKEEIDMDPGGEEKYGDGIGYKGEEELKRMNKDEIVAYAAQMGLNLDSGSLKADLVNDVLNHQEERM